MSADKHELARMLDAYRQAQTPAAGAQSRVWTAVESSVAPPAAASQSTPPAVGPAPGLGVGVKLLGVSAVVALAAGLWLFAAPAERPAPARPPAARAVPSPAPAPHAAAPTAAERPGSAAGAATEPASEERTIPGRHARTAEPAASSLALELKLVTAARAAIDAGDPDRALGLLRRHAQRFPQGALAEEREAALVEALCGLGRTGEASAAAERFGARFPGSPRSSRVREACAEAPR